LGFEGLPQLITVLTEEQETTAPSSSKQHMLRFGFNRVFYNSSQQSVYDAYPRDVVQGVLAGYNGNRRLLLSLVCCSRLTDVVTGESLQALYSHTDRRARAKRSA
jgi:hypothetical protein